MYHLKRWTLRYLEEILKTESLWEGDCFVFDKRVSVEHGLEPGNFKLCYGCKQSFSDADSLIWNPRIRNTLFVHIVTLQNPRKKRRALELDKGSLRLGASSVDLIRINDLLVDQFQSHQSHQAQLKMHNFLVGNIHNKHSSDFVLILTRGYVRHLKVPIMLRMAH